MLQKVEPSPAPCDDCGNGKPAEMFVARYATLGKFFVRLVLQFCALFHILHCIVISGPCSSRLGEFAIILE